MDTRPAATLFLEYKRNKTSGVSTFGFGSKYELYQAKEEEMTQEDFNRMMSVYLADLAKQEPGDWSADARSWAEDNGIVTGDEGGKRYKSHITREEAVVMLHRAIK